MVELEPGFVAFELQSLSEVLQCWSDGDLQGMFLNPGLLCRSLFAGGVIALFIQSVE